MTVRYVVKALLGLLLVWLSGCGSDAPKAPSVDEMRVLFKATFYEKANRAFSHEGYAFRLDERVIDVVGLRLVDGSYEAGGSAYRAVMKVKFRLMVDPHDKAGAAGQAAGLTLVRALEVDPEKMKAGDEFELVTEKVFLKSSGGSQWKLAP